MMGAPLLHEWLPFFCAARHNQQAAGKAKPAELILDWQAVRSIQRAACFTICKIARLSFFRKRNLPASYQPQEAYHENAYRSLVFLS